MKQIAFFISEHGFGHAARASAIIENLIESGLYQVHIFSQVPTWFFDFPDKKGITFHSIKADVGLVQTDPFHIDLEKTLIELDHFYSQDRLVPRGISELIRASQIDLIISDISPLGLLAAQQTGIPSLLVENFTWDWIYEPYINENPRFSYFIQYLRELFSQATFHFQTEPVCLRQANLPLLNPIFRNPRISKSQIRAQLNVPEEAHLTLITLGGIPVEFHQSVNKKEHLLNYFVIPAQNVTEMKRESTTILLPHQHQYFHPDLVHASDLVIGKAGYSTIAEVYSANVPFVYIGRENFREAPVLENYIERELNGIKITLEEFLMGRWQEKIDFAKARPDRSSNKPNGADQLGRFIQEILGTG